MTARAEGAQAKARALRAEARAWRRAAFTADAVALCLLAYSEFKVPTSMALRINAHMVLYHDETLGWAAFVLACLFLALECEDEARALRTHIGRRAKR